MICDAHIHIGDFFNGLYFSGEEIADWAVSQSIDKFLFFQTASLIPYKICYEKFLREADFLQSKLGDKKAIPALWLPFKELPNIKKYWKENFSALKIHPHIEGNLSDTNYKEIMQLALSLNTPLIIHTSYDEYASCLRFAKIAKNFPMLKLILAHGRPFEQGPEALKYSENIFIDTAYMPADEAQKLVSLGLGIKLIFASDYPIDKHFYPNEDANLRYANFKSAMQKILPQTALTENFKKLFTQQKG